MSLSSKQKAFVDEYLKDGNATRAAERAGYAGDDNTLAATGSRLLRNDKISAVIKERITARAMSADEVLSNLADIARGVPAEAVVTDGKGHPQVDYDVLAEQGRLGIIQAIETTAHGDKVRFYNRLDALDKLAKHHGLYREQSTTLNVDMSDLTEEQLQRIANGEDVVSVFADASTS